MKNNFIVPMTDDLMFKKMWGDPNGLRRTELLVSIMLKIPYELVKGNIEILETEKRLNKKKDKRQRNDILAKIKLSKNEKVNLELNLTKSQALIDRNITYLTHIFSSQLKNKENYNEIDATIQFNFNTFYVDEINKPVIDTYYIQNDNLNKLTKKLQITHINIEKCNKLCYNKDIKKYTKEEQEIIKICALMYEKNKEKLFKCLGEINMEEELKEEIEETIEEFSSNDEILAHFNSEKDLIALRNGEISEAEEKGYNAGIDVGIQKGIEQNKIEIAKNMLNENIDINIIIKVTGLTKEEVENIS